MREASFRAEGEVREAPRLSPALRAVWEERHEAELPDASLREWCDRGGTLPGAAHQFSADDE